MAVTLNFAAVGRPAPTTKVDLALDQVNNTSDANKPVSTAQQAAIAAVAGSTVAQGSSRSLTAADNTKIIECTGTLTLTIPTGLGAGFGCTVIANGVTSVAATGGALLNGGTTTLTRSATSNPVFAIISRASVADSYVVTGA